jgi:hypothetical protein
VQATDGDRERGTYGEAPYRTPQDPPSTGENIARLSDGTDIFPRRRGKISRGLATEPTTRPQLPGRAAHGGLDVQPARRPSSRWLVHIHSCITRLGSARQPGGSIHPRSMSWCQLARGIGEHGRVLATSLGHALSAAALLARARQGGHQNRPIQLRRSQPRLRLEGRRGAPCLAGWPGSACRPGRRPAHAGQLLVAGYFPLRLRLAGKLPLSGRPHVPLPCAARHQRHEGPPLFKIAGCCGRRWRLFSG